MTRPQLIVFPGWRDNPFPTVLALAAVGAGFDGHTPTQLEELVGRLSKAGRGDVLHMHWTSPVCQRAASDKEATSNLKQFKRAIRKFLAKGGHLVWTVHNELPHELNYPAQELELTQFLADTAEKIHIMNPLTAQVLEPEIVLPRDRIVEVPHPTFGGFYAQGGDRAAARASFDLDDDTRAVLFLGQLRAYKGLDTLFGALEALPKSDADRTVLLLAGRVHEVDLEELEAALPTNVRTVFEPGFVATADVARWYRAADVTVLPYERILNSGSALLASTFGTPVVLPRAEHLVSEFGEYPWIHFYDPDDAVAGVARLLSDESTFDRHADEVQEFKRERSPWHTSEVFARRVLGEWLPSPV